MHKLILMAATLCIICAAQAQPAPYTSRAVIPADAAVAVWSAPSVTYGPLLSIQTRDLGANTLKVDHLIAIPGGGVLTNAVEASAANATLHVYPSQYSPPQYYATGDVALASSPVKPVWLTPGDKLLFTSSATNVIGAASIVIRAGFPGK